MSGEREVGSRKREGGRVKWEKGSPIKREYFVDLKRVRDGGIFPLPVAVLQGQITEWYDCGIRARGIEGLRNLISPHLEEF